MREDADSEVGHGDNIRRSGGGASASFVAGEDADERWVVVWDYDPYSEGTTNEEDAEAPVYGLEGCLDVDAWTLGFSGYLETKE